MSSQIVFSFCAGLQDIAGSGDQPATGRSVLNRVLVIRHNLDATPIPQRFFLTSTCIVECWTAQQLLDKFVVEVVFAGRRPIWFPVVQCGKNTLFWFHHRMHLSTRAP